VFLVLRTVCKIALALVGVAGLTLGQGLTISARPGLLNYFEGSAFLNGSLIPLNTRQPNYLNANDTLHTTNGKRKFY
jgi:hypothetical protein